MTVYIIIDDLKIKEEFFLVADLAQFERDMNDVYGDLWFDNIEDANYYLIELED